jgi:hypothetical protein
MTSDEPLSLPLFEALSAEPDDDDEEEERDSSMMVSSSVTIAVSRARCTDETKKESAKTRHHKLC